MNREELISKCLLSFVSLKELGAKNFPVRMASGCVVRYNDRHFLLTVFHAVRNQQKWGLEIKYEHPSGMKTQLLGGFLFLKKIDLTSFNIEDVDFAIKELDKTIIPYYQEMSPDRDGKVLLEIPKIIHELDFDIKPSFDKRYLFAGLTKGTLDQNGQNRYFLNTQLTIEEGLTFLAENRNEDTYVFKLSRPHPGDEEYEGCSGSPILDDDGNIVSLVIGGDMRKDEIYGINLNRYKIILDIESGSIK